MFGKKFFRTALGILLILLIILIAFQIPGLSKIVSNITELVFIPVLIAGFIYYLLRPSVRFLEIHTKSRTLAIILTLLGAIGFAAFVIYFGGNIIYTEIRKLIRFLSDYETVGQGIDNVFAQVEDFGLNLGLNLDERISAFIQRMVSFIRNYDYLGIFASITQMAVTLLLVPFLVIYFLKDDKVLADKLIGTVPENSQNMMKEILKAVDAIFSKFIPNQLLVGIITGAITFVGYIMLGMPNPIGLAVILAVATLIPFIGPVLGFLPALFIGMTTSLKLLLQVAILMAIVEIFENNVIRPVLHGDKLKIHPVIVIFIILIGSFLFGVIGALFALPVYASILETINIIKKD
ncbi:MAG: AI-2E family transporter [Halanaerobiales bacterium]